MHWHYWWIGWTLWSQVHFTVITLHWCPCGIKYCEMHSSNVWNSHQGMTMFMYLKITYNMNIFFHHQLLHLVMLTVDLEPIYWILSIRQRYTLWKTPVHHKVPSKPRNNYEIVLQSAYWDVIERWKGTTCRHRENMQNPVQTVTQSQD